jgi:aminoglycoside 3-N-acetyltransferase
LKPRHPLIVHASLDSFGQEVRGGAQTLLGALLLTSDAIMMPTFTYKTMLIPESGPENNGITYGSGTALNRLAEFYRPDMPADPLMGMLAETLRQHPRAQRSNHPILSFSGINVGEALRTQTLREPLAPIQRLAQAHGWVLLIGVDHTVNTSIHLAERLAGRHQFVRWALTPAGVKECPNFPGCSDGFQQAEDLLREITRRVMIGKALIRALPLRSMLDILRQKIEAEPLALLCERADCERCQAVRKILDFQPIL